MAPPPLALREALREERFGKVWNNDLNDVFADVAPYYDIVTLQFASRHLRVREVFSEILRVLKPGGRFHHSDMLRPRNVIVKNLYYTYLRGCLGLTGLIVGGGPAATNAKQYFLDALELFYSAEELSILLRDLGYVDVKVDTVFHGMLGFHRAVKPAAR